MLGREKVMMEKYFHTFYIYTIIHAKNTQNNLKYDD